MGAELEGLRSEIFIIRTLAGSKWKSFNNVTALHNSYIFHRTSNKRTRTNRRVYNYH